MFGGTRPQLGRMSAASHSVLPRCAWALCALAAGVLSCNALLGIGEAALRCDTDPCATDVASALPEVTDDPSESALEAPAADEPARDAGGRGEGAGGASSESGISGTPTLLPAGGSSSAAPEPTGSDSGAGAGGSGPSLGGVGGAEPGAAGNAGAPPAPPASGGASSALCNSGDACGVCVCNACNEEFTRCADTPGCVEIVACARVNACVGFSCYCGTMDPVTCAVSGPGNGPCVDVTLAAPGSRVATLINPSAGPASDAALALSNCVGQSNACAAACQN
jgi:hypothetical protein